LFGRWEVAVALLWGFAEATLFFIVPDVFITLVATRTIGRSIACMLWVTVGALFGGWVMFMWSAQSPSARHAVLHVPHVTGQMIETVDQLYAQHGSTALFAGPLSGIPYKVFAVEGPGRVSMPLFLLVSIPARLERFVITWAIFATAGLLLRSRGRHMTRVMLAGWAVYWLVVYAIYLRMI
jgi:membrane protein YqaA with SNARE-associated domain